MFNNTKAFSGFSVDDLQKAKKFYGETLDLAVREDTDMDLLHIHLANDAEIVVYLKGKDHQPATFTILNFSVNDIDETVDKLHSKGVNFEQYGGEIKTDEKGIVRGGKPLIAWFKDPAGNILSVLQE